MQVEGYAMQSVSNKRRRNFVRVKSMRMRMGIFGAALAGLLFPQLPNAEAATPTPTLLNMGGAIWALYTPATNPNSSTAILVLHETDNFTNTAACTQLVQRGFTALCGKSQFVQDGQVVWDTLALDVKSGVSYLRTVPGVTHVILVGHSGGVPINAYYQNVAENGVAACQGADSLDPCSNSLAGLPAADGLVLLDGIPGLGFANMAQWDPSVLQPDGLTRFQNPLLNLFNPANGYNTNNLVSSNYSQSFINRYTAAQSLRETLLVGTAKLLEKQVANGTADFTEDVQFPLGHGAAAIWSTDTNLLNHTKGAYPLITPGGTTVTTVSTVRNPAAGGSLAATPQSNDAYRSGKFMYSAGTFLSNSAIKAPNFQLTADSITGVDWASSNTSTVANVAGISKPILFMSMTAHYWMVPEEMYYLAATKSSSRTLAYVYGALHGFTPCTVCTSMPLGPYGDTEKETFDYVANWLAAMF
jgi:hypothetical protein